MPRALDEFVDSPDTTPADATPVLNQQPTIRNTSYKLAIIGESPGAQECLEGRPFVGASGKLLSQLLSRAGILRDACFIGNVCQHRPPGNDISVFSRDGNEIKHGLGKLEEDLNSFQPNICLLLGKTALWTAKDVDEIGDWRGSLFIGTKTPFIGRKCVASYHPAACLRQWNWSPLLMFDLKKALAEAVRPELVLPERDLIIDLSIEEILSRLDQISTAKAPISVDSEGYWNALSCISIATSATHSFIIPFTDLLSNSIWPADDEARLWKGLSQVLADPDVPKIMQYGLYDRFALQYGHNCIVKGRQEDTMLKFWELYCELEKSLAFQCSIVTQEPYYKFERKVGDKATHYRYCCKDSAVTYEISTKLDKWLDSISREHYLFNIDLINPILFMELRGIRYDPTKAQAKLTQTTHAINELQSEIDLVTNRGIPLTASRSDILSQVQSAICYKRNPNQPKKGREGEWERAKSILKEQGEVSKADRGFLATVVGSGLNIKGAEFKKLLYEELKLPKQYHEVTGELTTNYQALLKLSKKSNHPILPLALDLGELRTRSQMLAIHADPDGRIRCGYNVVGTETGRLSCYTSPTGSGYNLQTIPAENHLKPLGHPLRAGMRDLFIADEGCYLFQCDLSGADGYTVAAHLANLGDSTMLEDYKAGIKPAKVLCYMLRHGAASLNGKTRTEIKELTKEVEKESWQYFACKIGQHGCITASHEVLTRSGWRGIAQVLDGEEILTVDLLTRCTRWEVPSRWTRVPYTGRLHSFEGTAYSLECTHDHRIPFETNGNPKWELAEQVIRRKGGRLPYTVRYFSGTESIPSKTARLICAIQADGCDTGTKITFHLRKERKIERLLSLLENRSYKHYVGADGTSQIEIKRTDDISNIKKIGAWILSWSYTSLAEFVDEIQYWDATVVENCVTFFSVNKETIDWVQLVCHLVNKGTVYQGTWQSGFGSTVHRLTINNRQFADIPSLKVRSVEQVENTMVYCPTVTSTFFLIKRKDKIAITGNTSYLMGARKLVNQIFIQSEGRVSMSESDVRDLQRLFTIRYRIKLWHDWMDRLLAKQTYPPKLVSASGHTRKFFGRYNEILGEALAHEPQSNTTYANNIAAHRLWTDPENRIGLNKAQLRVEPLHQIHDAILGQFKIEDTDWAIDKIKRWYNNELVIAGQKIVIPFEGTVGLDWAMDKKSKIKDII